jgi:hypothetical protein
MQPKSSTTKLLFWGVIIIVVVNVIVLLTLVFNRNKLGSSNALIFTQPVNTFTGVVSGVSNNKLTVVFTSVTPQEVGKNPEYTFDVETDENTMISQNSAQVPYMVKPVVSSALNSKALSDIKKGDTVTITTSQDLRLMAANKFLAQSVIVNETISMISGKVESVSGSSLQVKGIKSKISQIANVNPQQATEQRYTVDTTGTTEISSIAGTPGSGKAENVRLSELKTETMVSIYFRDTGDSRIEALLVRVEPAVNVNPPAVSITPSVSTSPTTVSISPTSAVIR